VKSDSPETEFDMNTSSIQRQGALYPEHIMKEAAAIREARAYRIQQQSSLGLSVPNEAEVFVIARSQAAVDNCLQKRADSREQLKRVIARCEQLAVGAA
jgi:hypothetical protein